MKGRVINLSADQVGPAVLEILAEWLGKTTTQTKKTTT